MSHYAKVVDETVVSVRVAEPDFFNNFVDSSPGEWIQTSYNTRGGVHYDPNTGKPSADQSKSLRKNYAGVGHHYDSKADAFFAPSPFESWILNQNTFVWEAPAPMPTDGKHYKWDEESETWK